MRADLIYVCGVGMTPFGRHPDLDVKGLRTPPRALTHRNCHPS